MLLSCQQVISELSNFIDGGVESSLRNDIESHLAHCSHCTAIYDGTLNVIRLVCDDRAFNLPEGLSERLYRRFQEETTKQS
jgi:anti-sigma factor (TIGR02949 family)